MPAEAIGVSILKKEDEALLERVQKYAPEVLEHSGVPENAFDELTRALIDETTTPKAKKEAQATS